MADTSLCASVFVCAAGQYVTGQLATVSGRATRLVSLGSLVLLPASCCWHCCCWLARHQLAHGWLPACRIALHPCWIFIHNAQQAACSSMTWCSLLRKAAGLAAGDSSVCCAPCWAEIWPGVACMHGHFPGQLAAGCKLAAAWCHAGVSVVDTGCLSAMNLG